MKLDNYCIALILLVAFLIYMNNNTEGFGSFGDAGAPVDWSSEERETKGSSDKEVITESVDEVQYVPIGLKPQKIDMEPPPSMVESMNMLSGAPANMESYMLIVVIYEIH